MASTFADLPLLPSLLDTLATEGLTTLTDVQARALPLLLDRRSVVAIAETGSGKTLAYALPMLDRLKRMELDGNLVVTEGEPRAIVLVPTRELAEQVCGVLKSLTHATRLRVRSVAGGVPLRKSRDAVAGLFEILVGTPGRIAKLLEVGALHPEAVRLVILDEADQLVEGGFRPEVSAVVRACPTQRQLALFSATMPPPVRELVGRLCPDAVVIETAGSHKVVPSLRTRHLDVADGRRMPVLLAVLREPCEGGTLLFANTRDQCDAVAAGLAEAGIPFGLLRGESDPVERKRALRAFRAGDIPLLVTTDTGARGLDIERATRVINVHLPQELRVYLHRVGRTARAGRDGVVVNLVTPRDAKLLRALDDGSRAPKKHLPPELRTRRAP